MTEETTQTDGQKTVVAFVAGLLVGGLLVWIFNDTPAEAPVTGTDADTEMSEQDGDMGDTSSETSDADDVTEVDMTPTTPEMPIGDGSASVDGVTAGSVLTLDGATFPTDEGWIAVRSYTNGELGWVLGAARYSREQGLIPDSIQLLSPMVAGREYAIVFFSENGDRTFNMATDAQLNTEITTFTAQ